MPLQSLVVTRDADALKLLRRAFDELNVQSENASTPERALELLAKRRFDAVIVDCDGLEGADKVLKQLRHTASNKRSLAFAVVTGKTTVRQAYDLGANFVLDKPLTMEHFQRSFRAAHGLMMRERRRYFRNPLSGAVFVATSDGREFRGKLLNLSEGGMSLQLKDKVNLNASVRLRFELPHSSHRIEAKAEVNWLQDGDKVGVRFLHVEQRMQRELEQWIARQADLDTNRPPAPMFINATAAKVR